MALWPAAKTFNVDGVSEKKRAEGNVAPPPSRPMSGPDEARTNSVSGLDEPDGAALSNLARHVFILPALPCFASAKTRPKNLVEHDQSAAAALSRTFSAPIRA